MTPLYNALPQYDKNIVDMLLVWVRWMSNANIVNDPEILRRSTPNEYPVTTKEIYLDYLSIRDDLEERGGKDEEILLPLMEILLGRRFKGFLNRYRKDHQDESPVEEWFDDIDMLIDMDLEASGDVTIDNIAFFIGADREFDKEVIQLSLKRFNDIEKVFKKKYAIDVARAARRDIQIDKDKVYRDRYDLYLFSHYAAKLSAWAIDKDINKGTLNKFLAKHKEMLGKAFSYNDRIGEDRLKRILSNIRKDIIRVLDTFDKRRRVALKNGEQALSKDEMIHHLADFMDIQTKTYSNGNNIIQKIDIDFTKKAIHFKTLQVEHLRYHSN